MSGKFITFEGGEGVGKSTQLARLAGVLRSHGKTVVTTREPGGTQGAEDIRALLMNGEVDRWNAQTEALLFAAARADHVAKLIRPALDRGEWVICDRFVDSTRAYQGGAGGLSDEDILALHKVGSGGLLPDRTLVLDLPVEEGTRRAVARSTSHSDAEDDRMGAKDMVYFDKVAARFRELAVAEPGRFRIIAAHGDIAEVTARIISALDDLL